MPASASHSEAPPPPAGPPLPRTLSLLGPGPIALATARDAGWDVSSMSATPLSYGDSPAELKPGVNGPTPPPPPPATEESSSGTAPRTGGPSLNVEPNHDRAASSKPLAASPPPTASGSSSSAT